MHLLMHIIGHEKEREMLGKMACGNMSERAFLFFGPSGIGKSLVAEEFARHLLRIGENENALSQDFLVLAPEGEQASPIALTKDLSIESVREAKDFLSRYPSQGDYRVVLILGAASLNHASQNALLKVLEEPNDASVLILVTTDRGMMLPTILSRVRQLSFSPLPEAMIRTGVEAMFPGSAGELEPFFFTLGRPGVVIHALENKEAFAKKRELLRSLFRISTLPYAERAKVSETLSEDVPEATALLEWWLSGLRASALRESSLERTKKFFGLLESIDATIRALRTVPVNARLQIDALLFSF
jgi:DNA polymerase-3 subunit delta'